MLQSQNMPSPPVLTTDALRCVATTHLVSFQSKHHPLPQNQNQNQSEYFIDSLGHIA